MSYDLYFVLDNQKASKKSFQATTFKVEENSRTFQGLAQKFKDVSRKNGIQGLFQDFPKIQGLFKTAWTLWKGTWCSETVKSMVPSIWFLWKSLGFQVTREQKKGGSALGDIRLQPHICCTVTQNKINNNKYKSDEVTPPHLLSTWLDGSRHSTKRLRYLVTHW